MSNEPNVTKTIKPKKSIFIDLIKPNILLSSFRLVLSKSRHINQIKMEIPVSHQSKPSLVLSPKKPHKYRVNLSNI